MSLLCSAFFESTGYASTRARAGTGATVGAMDALEWNERPTLRRPVLVAAFEG